MHRPFAFLLLILPLALTVSSQETAVGTSTITFGTGGGFAGYNPYGTKGGPAFNGTYEYRISKYLSVEAGVHNNLVSAYQYNQIYTSIPAGLNFTYTYVSLLETRAAARNTSVPFGFKGILPLRNSKIELFLGADGAYTWNANQGYQAWGVEGLLGARFAVDKQRHFWLGTSGEFLQEFGYASQHWTTWTADFAYRFGK